MSQPRVVIVGGGFGGLAAARALAKAPVEVTLVDRHNHHLFQPLLYQVATAALSPAEIAAPIRSILRDQANAHVRLDTVTGVCAARRQLSLASGDTVGYDWLILATGARHSYFGNDQWASHAPGLKTLDDALAVRRRVLLALERAESERDPAKRKALLTFVVIGGGPTGVEMAGAIAELARKSVSRDFRSITPHCSRVILAEAGSRLLPGFDARLSAKAASAIESLGVDLRLGEPVTEIVGDSLTIGRDRIAAATIVWAAGVQASPAAAWLEAAADVQGRIKIDPHLRVPGQWTVFAIGDTAHCPGSDGRPLPAIAPVAKQQGLHAADEILAALEGRLHKPFRYRDAGKLATIGRSRAVAEFGRVRLSGFPAWAIWCVAHLYFLVGFRSRLAVGLTWAWNYLTFGRSARLITGSSVDLPAAPPEFEAAA